MYIIYTKQEQGKKRLETSQQIKNTNSKKKINKSK